MPEIVTQDELILKSVTRYYEKHPAEYKCFHDITNLVPTTIHHTVGGDVNTPDEKKRFSISLIEYFILKYSKKNSIMYSKTNGDFFFVYANYKNFLKGYKKRFTDPFKRKDPRTKQGSDNGEIQFAVHDTVVQTRLAQLHFFRWVFENELLLYIERNYNTILEAKHSDDECKKTRRKKTLII